MRIALNNFVRRQTPESGFSHFEGSEEELIQIVHENFANHRAGYRDGVILVPVPADRFRTPIVLLNEDTRLHARFKARREGEQPCVDVTAEGNKSQALVAEIVLYRNDVLRENSEESTDADWEIISINARSTAEQEPMTPMAMARNFLGLTGGTKATYTAEEFAQAIVYWSQRARIEA